MGQILQKDNRLIYQSDNQLSVSLVQCCLSVRLYELYERKCRHLFLISFLQRPCFSLYEFSRDVKILLKIFEKFFLPKHRDRRSVWRVAAQRKFSLALGVVLAQLKVFS